MAESLLPCPFCGGEAAYEEVEDRASSNSEAIRFSVGCGNEDCIGCQSMTSFSRRIDAITAWNRRAGVETSTVYGADHPDDQGVELAEKPGRSSRVPGAVKAVESDGSALSTHFDIFGAVYRHALEIVHLTETVPAACFPVETTWNRCGHRTATGLDCLLTAEHEGPHRYYTETTAPATGGYVEPASYLIGEQPSERPAPQSAPKASEVPK